MASDNWLKEQRTGPRYQSMFYFKLRSHADDSLFGHVIDLSDQGMLILRQQALEEGSGWRVVMDLGDEVDGHSEIEVALQVRWCRPARNLGQFECGMKIKAVSREGAKVINQLARRQSFEAYVG